MINIIEILKDCPKGTELYSPIFGECTLETVLNYHIHVGIKSNDSSAIFDQYGKYCYDSGEILLFPSKDNRDWSKFKKHQIFKPFDKVVARNTGEIWKADLFSHYNLSTSLPYSCIGSNYNECLQFNEETSKLIGTSDDYK